VSRLGWLLKNNESRPCASCYLDAPSARAGTLLKNMIADTRHFYNFSLNCIVDGKDEYKKDGE
jgi:hypothetical protein